MAGRYEILDTEEIVSLSTEIRTVCYVLHIVVSGIDALKALGDRQDNTFESCSSLLLTDFSSSLDFSVQFPPLIDRISSKTILSLRQKSSLWEFRDLS